MRSSKIALHDAEALKAEFGAKGQNRPAYVVENWPYYPNSSPPFLLQKSSNRTARPSIKLRMASRSFSKALQKPLQHQWIVKPVQTRAFVSLVAGAKQATVRRPNAPTPRILPSIRGVKTIDFAGSKEQVFGELLSEIR